jgi:hypothetical protein
MKEYTEVECQQLLDTLFPNGFGGADVMAIIAPDGWANTPYKPYVPTVEQAYETAKARQSLDELMARFQMEDAKEVVPIGDFDDFKANYQPETPNPSVELQDLMGSCVWDIFSDNNDVVKDNKVYHLGSFRGSAEFIAEWLNTRSDKSYMYMDFYMGTGMRDADDADMSPFYKLIFRRLKAAGCDWHFNFTQIGIVDFSNFNNKETPNLEDYDPNKALEEELKQKEKQKEKDDFKAKLDEMNAQEREDALYKPPPKVVQAYKTVFGKFPIGWPPVV